MAARALRSGWSGDSTARLEERWGSRKWKGERLRRGGPICRGRDKSEDRRADDNGRSRTERRQLGRRDGGGQRAALAVITASAGGIVMGPLSLTSRPVEQRCVEGRQAEAAAHEHKGEQECAKPPWDARGHESKVDGGTGGR
jgi:hypothetical protein